VTVAAAPAIPSSAMGCDALLACTSCVIIILITYYICSALSRFITEKQ
jgi:hypothetical protein